MGKTRTVKLGDEQNYNIGVFTVGDLIDIEKRYGKVDLASDKIEPIIYWFWLALKHCHKEITLEKLYELIDAPFISGGGLALLFTTMSELNGWDKTKNAVTPEVASQ